MSKLKNAFLEFCDNELLDPCDEASYDLFTAYLKEYSEWLDSFGKQLPLPFAHPRPMPIVAQGDQQ